jgi:hypothetical protein
MKLARAFLLATPMMLLPAVSHAQVAYNYLNYYCLWNPSAHEYSIEVHRFPGQTLEHVITDQGITSAACTADPVDLMNWIQHDLQANDTWTISQWPNGSWGQSNDQVETKQDVFCPDVSTTEYPTSLGTMYGTVYAPTYSGGNFQTSVNLNYACPNTPQNPGSGGSTPVTATYANTMCANGKLIATINPSDDASVQLINMGSSGVGVDDWQMNLLDQSGPYSYFSTATGTPHCDMTQLGHVNNYMFANGANATMNTLKCDPQDTMTFYVDSCEERGDDSVYGYQVMCCPPPAVTHGTATGTNCHSVCLPTSVNQMTQFFGPPTPIYTDPNTVCHDLVADTTTWFNTMSPGGPTQPMICGPNWGVAQGGWYVPNTLNMTCNVASTSDPTCLGDARVDVCLTYQCEN